MTRTIPHSLAPVLEQLELYQADLVTTARLDELVRAAGIRTATRTVATRLVPGSMVATPRSSTLPKTCSCAI